MDAGQRFRDPYWYPEQDHRHVAVDLYVREQLLTPRSNPLHDAIEYAHKNSIENGLPDISVSPVNGKFLAMQAKLAHARNILEVGTLGGYGALWMASSHPEARITTIEIDENYKALAEEHFQKAGVEDRIKVVLGDAKSVLNQLRDEVQSGTREPFDFAFLDADKYNALLYFSLALDMMKPQSPLYFDNVVRQGGLADPKAAKKDLKLASMRELVEGVGKMDNVDAVVLQTVGDKSYDGFLFALKK